jgi:phage terminase large subunit
MFPTSDLYTHNLESQAEVVVNQGGTSSGKTYSIIQALCTLAHENNNAVITVAGQDIPNLKVGAMRDMETIVESSEALRSIITAYNKSDRKYTFSTGSIIEFKSYKDAQDAKSGKRNFLFVNEANGIHHNVYTELALRTIDKDGIKSKIFLDYNPNCEFWVHRELVGHENVELIISDHRHNPFLDQKTRDKIEKLKERDHELWKVYARGRTGKIEGLIFRNYKFVPAIPAEAKFIGYCMDFGFTNDPTALIEVYMHDGELWMNELIYETGLTNPDIAKRMSDLGLMQAREIVADSAEPKSIAELTRLGWNVRPAEKGKDSIKNGIDILKRYKINITQRSANLRKEIAGYRWKTNLDGTLTNEPIGVLNHALDAIRYLALNKLAIKGQGKYSII